MPVEYPFVAGKAVPMLNADRIVIPFDQLEDGSLVFETDTNTAYIFLAPNTWQAVGATALEPARMYAHALTPTAVTGFTDIGDMQQDLKIGTAIIRDIDGIRFHLAVEGVYLVQATLAQIGALNTTTDVGIVLDITNPEAANGEGPNIASAAAINVFWEPSVTQWVFSPSGFCTVAVAAVAIGNSGPVDMQASISIVQIA